MLIIYVLCVFFAYNTIPMNEEYRLIQNSDGTLANILYISEQGNIPIIDEHGIKRELQCLHTIASYKNRYQSILPIFIGFGAGFAIQQYSRERAPFILIDLEHLYQHTEHVLSIDMTQSTLLQSAIAQENLTLLDNTIQKLQYPLCIPIIHPFVKKHLLQRYQPYIQRCRELARLNPFGKTRYKRFIHDTPHILCLWQQSFISREITHALQQEGIEYTEIAFSSYESTHESISRIIENIQSHRPDFVLTLNNTGFDTSNVIAEVIQLFQIPVASWFMDSPELDIEKHHRLLNNNMTVFTYDAENIPYLNSIGIEHAYYLPLGTNIAHFTPPTTIPEEYILWRAPLGFLGDSRTKSIQNNTRHAYTPMLHIYSKEIAHTFRISSLYTVQQTIEQYYPFLYEEFMQLALAERRDYIQLILDYATQTKRAHALINANIVECTILGDSYWQSILPDTIHGYIGEEISYQEARYLYAQVDMVLNSTCTQMKHAVNQRIFDCPIAGALVITEYTPQLEQLFTIGTEVVCYTTDEEVREKIIYYHTNVTERMDIVHRARQRIHQEHTWGHRIQTIISTMKELYG